MLRSQEALGPKADFPRLSDDQVIVERQPKRLAGAVEVHHRAERLAHRAAAGQQTLYGLANGTASVVTTVADEAAGAVINAVI